MRRAIKQRDAAFSICPFETANLRDLRRFRTSTTYIIRDKYLLLTLVESLLDLPPHLYRSRILRMFSVNTPDVYNDR